MTRVLLTGASGFIATHILDILLDRGYSARFTVRTQKQADTILAVHNAHASRLDYVLVPEIGADGAFDEAVKSDPPLDAILHTASPVHTNFTDTKTKLLEPAINGTISLLKAVKKYAPSVKRVVITSSFASIIDGRKGNRPGYTYTEADWNPITLTEAEESKNEGYRASKTFAERAAWDFVAKEEPSFDLATINPPLVIGPVKAWAIRDKGGLDAINTSNQRTRDIVSGAWKDGLGRSRAHIWADVRDVAAAHVLAFEKPEAGGKRFLVAASAFSNQQIADVVGENFPEYRGRIPEKREENDGFPEGGAFGFDNGRSKEVLGLKYRSLDDSIKDLVMSLKELGL